MCKKILVTCISQALICGGLLFSVSSSALADSYYNQWQPSYSSQAGFAKYRFRPLETARNTRYNYATGSYQQPALHSGQYRNLTNKRFAFNQRVPSRYSHKPGFNFGNPYVAYQNTAVRQPAFVRQYGWMPANKMVVRRVSTSDHFASSTNSYVAETSSSAPVYRTAPINTQGFRYRDMTRNAPYVSFSDRVKQFTKMEDRFMSHQPPVIQHVRTQAIEQRPLPPVVKMNPASRDAGGNFSFRPDQRFAPKMPVPQIVVKPRQGQGDFHLVDAKVQETGDNFLDNWSFRPVESTF